MANISFATLGSMAASLLGNVIAAIIIYIVGKKLISVALAALDKATAKAGTDETLRRFLMSAARIALYVLLIFIIVSQLGVNTASLITVLGSAAIAVGLALQGSLSNLAGGVLILVTRPFKIGDYIISAQGEGSVEEINLIATRLMTLDKKTVIIPNSALSASTITNCSTSPTRRIDIIVPISYKSDVTRAREIIESVYNNHPLILKDGTVASHVDSLGDSGVMIAACGFVNGGDYWPVRWQLIEDIKAALTEGGIEIPYNQIDVHVQNS